MLLALIKSLVGSSASEGGGFTRGYNLLLVRNNSYTKKQDVIDRSKVPKLDENDLEENFISGSGPGGQNVNKAVNCCQLRHNPSGIVIKVHQSRELERNRQIAREIMTTRLDNLYNGEQSVESQKKRLAQKRIAMKDAERQRRQALKEEFKKFKDSNSYHRASPD